MTDYPIFDGAPSEINRKVVAWEMACPSCKQGDLRWVDIIANITGGRLLHKCDVCGAIYAVLGGPYPRLEVK